MPYMTSTERMLADKYRAEGLRHGIAAVLELKFGTDSLQLLPLLDAVTDADQLQTILRTSKMAADLAEVRSLLQ
jgi:hypothetical protein